MSKGVLLFAFNSPKFNYFDMAVHTAKRVNYFLDLPVTVVTDSQSKPNNLEYNFDQIIITDSDSSNKRDWGIWLNKGRYKAFELSPYHHTILLDTDYMVNSQKLLKTFTLPTDFCCHDTTEFLMNPNAVQEVDVPAGDPLARVSQGRTKESSRRYAVPILPAPKDQFSQSGAGTKPELPASRYHKIGRTWPWRPVHLPSAFVVSLGATGPQNHRVGSRLASTA